MEYKVKFDIRTKRLILIVVFLTIIVCVCVMYWAEGRVKKRGKEDFYEFEEIYASENRFDYSIDAVDWQKEQLYKYLVINGWIYLIDENINNYKCQVALEDAVCEKVYILPTQMVTRSDIAEEKENGSYNNAGFRAVAQDAKIETENINQEIIILYENNFKKIYFHTETFVENEN